MRARSFQAIQQAVVRCARCPELRAYCAQVACEKKRAYRDWEYWGRPVPAFGDGNARVALVGLAPGAHGSNRTGRMFTGDSSGDFLYPALHRAGFANRPFALSREDGVELSDCTITAALRCAPPGNKPSPAQLRRCFPYLVEELRVMERLQVVVGLGAIGTKAALRALRELDFSFERRVWKFGHGAELHARRGERAIAVIASFHPSRQNTNTGKLTRDMFDDIFTRARSLLS
ncbi:MAG: uracil-DNA glycosylase [Candidatus Baltobacteraceae bacterium]